MDTATLRKEFEKQISDADQKVEAAQRSLNQLKEYRLKLQGGMETLELLDGNDTAQAPQPPAVQEPPTE